MSRVVSAGGVAAFREGRGGAKWLGNSLRVGVAVEEVAEADAAHLTWAARGDILLTWLGSSRSSRLDRCTVACTKRKRWKRPLDAICGKGTALWAQDWPHDSAKRFDGAWSLKGRQERNRWQWSRGVDVCILWVFKDRAWAVMEGIQAMHGSVHCFLYKSRVGLGGGCKVEVTSRSRVGAAMLGWGP